MSSLTNQLSILNDQDAIQLLELLAQSDINYTSQAQELTGLTEPPLNAKQQTELARTTLAVIAEQDSQQLETIQALLNNSPSSRSFDGGTTVLSLAAVIWLLRTQVEIKYKDGKWEFLLKNKPPKNSLLVELIQKIKAILGQSD
ncbi:MAG: hypothetical protein NMNS01_28280 [Nitrosomonas sp.]|nr:MAG: hypothetical protein NMNS01_28280 [Nitrosomonas sp.]